MSRLSPYTKPLPAPSKKCRLCGEAHSRKISCLKYWLTRLGSEAMSLHPLHLEDLRRSGLTDPIIEVMGARSLPPADINRLSPGGLPVSNPF